MVIPVSNSFGPTTFSNDCRILFFDKCVTTRRALTQIASHIYYQFWTKIHKFWASVQNENRNSIIKPFVFTPLDEGRVHELQRREPKNELAYRQYAQRANEITAPLSKSSFCWKFSHFFCDTRFSIAIKWDISKDTVVDDFFSTIRNNDLYIR